MVHVLKCPVKYIELDITVSNKEVNNTKMYILDINMEVIDIIVSTIGLNNKVQRLSCTPFSISFNVFIECISRETFPIRTCCAF